MFQQGFFNNICIFFQQSFSIIFLGKYFFFRIIFSIFPKENIIFFLLSNKELFFSLLDNKSFQKLSKEIPSFKFFFCFFFIIFFIPITTQVFFVFFKLNKTCDAPNPGGPVDQLSTCGIPVCIAYLDTTLSCLIHRDSSMSKSSPTRPFQPYSKYYSKLCHNSP